MSISEYISIDDKSLHISESGDGFVILSFEDGCECGNVWLSKSEVEKLLELLNKLMKKGLR